MMRLLVDALQRYLLQPGKIHSDDTPMPVLALARKNNVITLRIRIADITPAI